MYQTARDPQAVDAFIALGYRIIGYGQDARGLFCRLFLSLK